MERDKININKKIYIYVLYQELNSVALIVNTEPYP